MTFSLFNGALLILYMNRSNLMTSLIIALLLKELL